MIISSPTIHLIVRTPVTPRLILRLTYLWGRRVGAAICDPMNPRRLRYSPAGTLVYDSHVPEPVDLQLELNNHNPITALLVVVRLPVSHAAAQHPSHRWCLFDVLLVILPLFGGWW